MSVCLSVRPQGTTQLPYEQIPMKFYVWDFLKICQESSSFIKILQ